MKKNNLILYAVSNVKKEIRWTHGHKWELIMAYFQTLKEVIGFFKNLSVLEKVAKKLVNNTDAVSEKISVVLSELAISYQALDDALVNLAILSFKKQEDLDEARKYLPEAQGLQIKLALMPAIKID